jgi:preprotein translocase subunit SecF
MTAGLFHRLYHGETTFDFVGRRKIGFMASGAVLLITLISLFAQGLNLGIDFEGGVSWEFDANGLTTEQAESILGDNGIDATSAKIQEVSGGDGVRLRIQADDQTQEVETAIKDSFSAAADGTEVSVSTVSPTWGEQITRKAINALVVFFVLISAFIAWRFEWKMAIAAIAAVVHDVLVSVGVYSVLRFEVTPATVIAFLTILGFSLYDTIVVFDKVQENTKKLANRVSYGDIVNLSMNQTLMRSLNTTIAAVLPVLSVLVIGSWILGAVALEEFALALLVGLATGAYSSIFIATPILAILKEREPKYRDMAARRTRSDEIGVLRQETMEASAPRRPTAAPGTSPMPGAATLAGQEPTTVLTHPPRPRKKRRR